MIWRNNQMRIQETKFFHQEHAKIKYNIYFCERFPLMRGVVCQLLVQMYEYILF